MRDSAHGFSATILVLEDDADVRRLLQETFSAAGFEVFSAGNVGAALAVVSSKGLPALAIVDLRLEGESGIEFCRRVHEFSDLPIVVLTSVTDAHEATATIERYAEDYVRKPFDARELLARVQRILRRVGAVAITDARGRLKLAPELFVDLVAQKAWNGGIEVSLTPTECRILHVLARNAGRTVESATLLRRLWPDQEVFEDTLRVHIHRLRRKLEHESGARLPLATERGLGYRLEIAS